MHKILTTPLLPADTLGAFKLGDSIKNVLPLLYQISYEQVKVGAWHWKQFVYTLFDSIEISVDASRGDIVQIRVGNNYQGKFANKIGIGSTIRELFVIEPDLHILDYKIFVGCPEFYIFHDFDGEPETIQDAFDAKITYMTLEIHGWNLRE